MTHTAHRAPRAHMARGAQSLGRPGSARMHILWVGDPCGGTGNRGRPLAQGGRTLTAPEGVGSF
eukprot:7555631-Pyramimonas_sp.AAC.1